MKKRVFLGLLMSMIKRLFGLRKVEKRDDDSDQENSEENVSFK